MNLHGYQCCIWHLTKVTYNIYMLSWRYCQPFLFLHLSCEFIYFPFMKQSHILYVPNFIFLTRYWPKWPYCSIFYHNAYSFHVNCLMAVPVDIFKMIQCGEYYSTKWHWISCPVKVQSKNIYIDLVPLINGYYLHYILYIDPLPTLTKRWSFELTGLWIVNVVIWKHKHYEKNNFESIPV